MTLLSVYRFRRSRSKMFFKIVVLKIFTILTRKHLYWSLLLIKETPTQVISCEYCDIFKNKFFNRTSLVVAFDVYRLNPLDYLTHFRLCSLSQITWVHQNMRHFQIFRSNHHRCSVEKSVLKNFVKFTGKHLCWNLFFTKVSSLRPTTLLKKRLHHRFFLWIMRNFYEHVFYRTPPDDCFWIFQWGIERENRPEMG